VKHQSSVVLTSTQESMSAIANLHTLLVRKDVHTAKLTYQLALFKKYGSRHKLKPGWQRPEYVDVVDWGAVLCLVRDVATGRHYVFPMHQFEGFS
jgi:hypothetical protein